MKIWLLFVLVFLVLCDSGCKRQTVWKKMPSPLASSIRSFAEKDDDWYVATTSGVYKSSNGGRNWEISGLKGKVVDKVFVTSSGSILAGVYRSGLYRSADNGHSWTQIGFHRNVYLYSIVQNEIGVLFLAASFVSEGAGKGTKTGVFTSADNGNTWQQTSLTKPDIVNLSLPRKGLLIASTKNETYLSKDDGKSWTPGGSGLPDSIPISSVISVNNILYASLGDRQEESGSLRGGIFLSTDGGLNWIKSDAGIDSRSPISDLGVYDGVLIASAGFEQKTGYVGLYRSADKGKTWQKYRLTDKSCRFIALTRNGKMVVGTNNTALFLSDNIAKKFRQIGLGIDNWETFRVTGRSGNVYASGNGIWKFMNKEKIWKLLRQSNSTDVALTANGRLLIFENNQIILSDDKENSWSTVKDVVGDYAIFKVLNDQLIIASISGNGSWNSTDQGLTWKKYNVEGFEKASMRTACLSPRGTLFLSGTAGRPKTFRSLNQGETFTNVGDLDSLEIWGFEATSDAIYAGTYALGIYKSVDDGAHWLPHNRGLRIKNEYVTVTSIVAIDNRTVVCSTLGKGLFISEDSGANWKSFNQGIADENLWTLYFDRKSRSIFSAGPSGIYNMILPSLRNNHLP
jgi:hypothetical protein